ncbi:chemotaxis response regulator protein-glutamate methylesterase [Oceanotoga sp. DSM 15011]|uniref:Protein-glutamate methylesterase/protein-glutamine glutaminase n=1 Tax=Oceanotoga teriensis TaxID=515440 RepID=A0AA45C6F2_9BACT|nr:MULTISPECIES: chemotaxis response regulator protein-glutamate methylesterase [Oceanotoga]MDN5343364.1 two-component system, chemotaxis family, protein-glutamate methylesterase/glutaminase [Oceanotoga sp.]MDO7975734.1 chemotaxis response regulator protein-glutamate methylesterase [Oceanotoga teriensis]PWJ91287.1 two-component system chemotaxis response regulator CheB [Oceanotoga teriensis]UYO99761.1 chemotaxis response regulator protein-glutamate methylesterase [Oceanotoga sp. DSM 15011]
MIKVLIIDDSAMVRKVLSQNLSKERDIEVVGTAPEPYSGRDKILKLKPDVLILDIEMPKMDGLTFLEKLMSSYPMPVIIYSSVAEKRSENAMRALELGAVDVISKPGGSYSTDIMLNQLIDKIKAAHKYKFSISKKINDKSKQNSKVIRESMIRTTDKIIAIGASTGGTQALRFLIGQLPSNMPPIIITQHMPQTFTKSFANSLNERSKLEVVEAQDGELLRTGKVLIAPGNYHMILKRDGARYYVQIKDGPPVYHQRPSVEVMFYSVAKYAGKNAIGIILTGMGKDGAEGLLEMRNSGAYTIAQSEKSCVVFGMPREAIRIEAADKILDLEEMPDYLVRVLKKDRLK